MKKKETIEEIAERFYSEQSKGYEDSIEPMFDISRYLVVGFIEGAKWQQEKELDKLKEALEIIRKFVNEFDEEGEVSYNTRDEAEIFLSKQQEQ